MIAIGALMLVLIQGTSLAASLVVGVAVMGMLALLALLVNEIRTPEPMLALELLRDRVIVVGSVDGALAGAVMMGVSAFLPTYVQGAMGRNAMIAGLVLGAMSVTWALSSIFGGRLMVRTSYRLAAVMGATSLLVGCAVLVLLTPTRGLAWATAGSLIIGAGMGFCNTAFIVSIQAAVAWNKRGAATSWCLFLRFIGQAVGAAAFGAILNATIQRRTPVAAHSLDRLLKPELRATLPQVEQTRLVDLIAAGLHNAYWLACALSVITLVLVSARASQSLAADPSLTHWCADPQRDRAHPGSHPSQLWRRSSGGLSGCPSSHKQIPKQSS